MQQYSEVIDHLFSALNIQHDQSPDFQNWLDRFCSELNIQHCQLSIFYTLIEKSENFTKGSYSQVLNNPHNIQWSFENTQISISYAFNSEFDHNILKETFTFLEPFIRSSLNLGVKHAEYQYITMMQQSSYDMMRIAIFTLENNLVVGQNHYAQRLITSGHLTINEGQLFINHEAIPLHSNATNTFYWKVDDTRLQGHIFQHSMPNIPWEVNAKRSWLLVKVTSMHPPAEWLTSLFDLTESQALVASYACQGLSAKEISRETKLTTHTVYSYLKAIYQKLGINNQAQLASAIWPRLPV
ncbi:MAG: helix-turn-helix transcriptional regulator [Gammaproteobacteria bacterium]|nr:helix-turn-helix transcriptional regulator [Gammaproteobacteria bacterium]